MRIKIETGILQSTVRLARFRGCDNHRRLLRLPPIANLVYTGTLWAPNLRSPIDQDPLARLAMRQKPRHPEDIP